MSTTTDWYAWHAPYDDLVSPQTLRLAAVQGQIGRYLDGARPGALRTISIAAGQSRDLLPILIEHPRGRDVAALLVELDSRNVDFAQGAAASTGLEDIQFVTGDAGVVDTFAPAVPADLVLICGVLDHIDSAQVTTTIEALPQLCAPHATVIWADGPLIADEHRRRRELFAMAGFLTSESSVAVGYTIGVHELTIPPPALSPGTRMFDLR
jgi:hypothetical protein